MLSVPLYESELKKLCATDEYKSKGASARPKMEESLERRVANEATKQATAGGEKATPRDQLLGRRAKQEAEPYIQVSARLVLVQCADLVSFGLD